MATTEETVALDLQRLPRDVPIATNEKVLSYVELFQGRLHDFMQAALDRANFLLNESVTGAPTVTVQEVTAMTELAGCLNKH